VRGFLVLGTILVTLVGWLFYAAPSGNAAGPGAGHHVSRLVTVP
jgi:hypothetical protein